MLQTNAKSLIFSGFALSLIQTTEMHKIVSFIIKEVTVTELGKIIFVSLI